MGHFGALYPAYIYLCRTLRVRPHDRPRMTRGQDGFATPFLYDSFIHYSTPVYPDAPEVRPASFYVEGLSEPTMKIFGCHELDLPTQQSFSQQSSAEFFNTEDLPCCVCSLAGSMKPSHH